jgi:hypothetical protein
VKGLGIVINPLMSVMRRVALLSCVIVLIMGASVSDAAPKTLHANAGVYQLTPPNGDCHFGNPSTANRYGSVEMRFDTSTRVLAVDLKLEHAKDSGYFIGLVYTMHRSIDPPEGACAEIGVGQGLTPIDNGHLKLSFTVDSAVTTDNSSFANNHPFIFGSGSSGDQFASPLMELR